MKSVFFRTFSFYPWQFSCLLRKILIQYIIGKLSLAVKKLEWVEVWQYSKLVKYPLEYQYVFCFIKWLLVIKFCLQLYILVIAIKSTIHKVYCISVNRTQAFLKILGFKGGVIFKIFTYKKQHSGHKTSVLIKPAHYRLSCIRRHSK